MSRVAIVVDGDRVTEVAATETDGRLLLSPDHLERATGWGLRAEGLCRGSVCVPVPEATALRDGDDLDLMRVAEVLDRPLAFEPDPPVAVLGDAVEALTALGDRAPAFTLPDLDGNLRSLDDDAGRKRLLVAWASW
jgi:hypothetical protein